MDKKDTARKILWASALVIVICAAILFAKGKTSQGATFMAIGSMFMIIAISQNKKPD